MPAQNFGWLPDSDVAAIVSYVCTVATIDRPNGSTVIKPVGKVLDRLGKLPLIARHIDHGKRETPPPPEPTATYVSFLAPSCSECHGAAHFVGGRIPGAPDTIPYP